MYDQNKMSQISIGIEKKCYMDEAMNYKPTNYRRCIIITRITKKASSIWHYFFHALLARIVVPTMFGNYLADGRNSHTYSFLTTY